jgi:hypothetical protein
VSQPAAAQAEDPVWLVALEAYMDEWQGQICIGRIDRFPCAAVASDRHDMPVALVRRDGESVKELLERLGHHLLAAMEDGERIDEINNRPRPSRR